MGLYRRFVLPSLIEKACGNRVIGRQRRKIVPAAEGRVLEIGVGSGLNLGYYDPAKVDRVYGLDPSGPMVGRARRRAAACKLDIEFLELKSEEIPLPDRSVDTVLVTYTLCTIGDLPAAFAQMRRVLAPGGRLLFCEHGAAPDLSIRKWQDRLNPIWQRIAGGCNLNREIPKLIGDNGFRIDSLEVMYLPRIPRFAGYNYRGMARPA